MADFGIKPDLLFSQTSDVLKVSNEIISWTKAYSIENDCMETIKKQLFIFGKLKILMGEYKSLIETDMEKINNYAKDILLKDEEIALIYNNVSNLFEKEK